MRLAKRQNNETILLDKIENISKLDNSELIILERGDKLKKSLKNANTAFGVKNLYSVKIIRDTLNEITIKKSAKKVQVQGWCMVCVENLATAKDGYCNDCRI